jgi:hypothetical protein
MYVALFTCASVGEKTLILNVGRFHPVKATKALRESRGIALLFF